MPVLYDLSAKVQTKTHLKSDLQAILQSCLRAHDEERKNRSLTSVFRLVSGFMVQVCIRKLNFTANSNKRHVFKSIHKHHNALSFSIPNLVRFFL